MAVSDALNSLNVDIQSQVEGIKPGLSAIDRVITIRNRGTETANIELWLEPHDLKAEPLQRWGTFNRSDAELVIAPNQEMDVQLSFAIPLEAEPGFYGYNLRVRSPQYPNQDLQRSQQLQVFQSEQELELRREPKFVVTPFTSSEDPLAIQADGMAEFTIMVENPSRRTDRFFLNCRDLPKTWFTVCYPEMQGNLPGVVQESDGLELNPKETGEIKFQIHPPQFTPAGQYFPTIQLSSSNYSEIALLDIVYLTLEIDDRLIAEISPPERKIPVGKRNFTLTLTNQGNIDRAIALSLHDIDHAFNYQSKPPTLQIQPGATASALLQFKPRRWINRLWHLREEEINVEVELHNQYRFESLEEENNELVQDKVQDSWHAALPKEPLKGKVTWRTQRRWLFLLLLLTVGLVGLTLLLSLLWYFLIWRPSLRPQITLFDTSRGTYQEGIGQGVTLNVEVTNPQNIGALALSFDRQSPLQVFPLQSDNRQPGAQQPRRTNRPKLSEILPSTLAPYCSVEERPGPRRSWLTPLLRLNRIWRTGSPNEAYIRCRDLPPQGFSNREGEYEFKLLVYGRQAVPGDDRAIATAYIEDLTVIAPLAPAILEFSSTAPEYKLVDRRPRPPGARLAPPQTARDSSLIGPILPSPPPPIRLNWQISNLADIEALSLSSAKPDGSAHDTDVIFRFDGGIPRELRPFCRDENNILICEAVVTNAQTAGEYIFTLVLTSSNPNASGNVVAKTPTIPIPALEPILPPAAEILGFWVNGQLVADRPKQIYTINPARKSFDVVLSWQVENAVQVELLPAPGLVEGNQLTYSLSAEPGATSITLRALNAAQEEVTQTVVIQKVAPTPGSSAAGVGQNQSGNPNSTPLTEPAPVLPPTENPLDRQDDQLPAFELPPQPD